LRCKVFFIFFEFIIALFAHVLFSRELFILFFDSRRMKIDDDFKKMLDFKRSLLFLFLILITFHLEKIILESVSDFVNDVVDEFFTTNLNIFEIVCDSFTRYNLIRFWWICSIFFFFSQRILQFENHAICSRFPHVSHILYFSVIVKSHSLM
jgi:hypothetical protein